jgi:hypothetical protein
VSRNRWVITLKRWNGKVKQRPNVVGIFLNEKAIRRLAGALLLGQIH